MSRGQPLELRHGVGLGVVVPLAKGRLVIGLRLAKRRKRHGNGERNKQAFHAATLADHPAARNLNKPKNRHLAKAMAGIA